MKKILLMFAVSVLLLTGCGKENNSTYTGDNTQGTNTSTPQPKKKMDDLSKVLNEVDKSSVDKDGYRLAKKNLGEISLEKIDSEYVLNVAINNAVSFSKEKLAGVVKQLNNEEIETVGLDDFTFNKIMPESLKEYLDGMKAGGVSGIALDYWKDYSDTYWLNDDGIPVFIEDVNGNSMYILKNVDESEPDKYYLFRMVVAGQDGLYSVPSDVQVEVEKYYLKPTDTIEWRRYEVDSTDEKLVDSKSMTVEEYFNSNSSGETININEKIKIENGKLVLELYDGGN